MGADLTRRAFIGTSGVAAGALTGCKFGLATEALAPHTQTPTDLDSPVVLEATLRINGTAHDLMLDTRTSLLDALCEQLQLTGTKKGCDHGQCGACTVLINGRRINACLTLAVMLEGDEITTIEGLAQGGQLHPLHKAFITRDAFQCGYCTPGQICSAMGALKEMKAGWPSHATSDVAIATVPASDDEIRERMSGNLCRCSARPNVLAAIRDVVDGA